jgi:hypothetical protein
MQRNAVIVVVIQSVLCQVHSLFQSEFFKEGDLVIPISNSRIFSFFLHTFTAKVDRGRFKYLPFNLPASTLVDLKFTLLFCLK